MNKNNRALIPLLSTLFLGGCQGIQGLAPPGDDRSRIVITAQSGSEVVLTKNVHGAGPTNRAPDSETAFPGHALPGASVPDLLPDPEGRLDDGAVPPLTQPAAIPPLGALRAEPWHVQPGETLFEAVSRFAIRAGKTAQKSETYPVWEITTHASFEGEFEAALEWLMAGFEHTNPRPVLSLHPNGIVRLMAE